MTEIGEIPEEWEVKSLEKYIKIRSGNSPKNFDLSVSGKYPFYKVDDLNYTSKYLNKSKFYFNKCSYPLMPKGMVVFPKRGAAIFTNKVAILENEGYFDTNIMGLICKKGLNNEYLFYQIIFLELKKFADTTAIPQINNKHVNPLKLPIPPLKEQQKIASILSTVDEHIEQTDKLIEKTKELKKGLMQKLLTKGIGHTEFKKTEIGEIPAEWEVKKLGELGLTYNGLSGKNKDDFGRGKPFIPYKNIFDNSKIDINYLDYVVIKEDENQNKVEYGDIFFTTSSETPEEVGMSSVILEKVDELYLNSFCFGFRLNDFSVLLPEFARYLFRGSKIRKKISKLAQGSTRFNLSKTQLLKIIIPIPPLQEQQKIASILSEVDNQIEQYQLKKEKLETLKKGLMQQLLTGKKRVKV